MLIFRHPRRPLCRLLICLSATAAVLAETVGAQAQDASEFHELETKYIFGNFTIGSATGIEGEMAFEPETEADFGKRFGSYAASITAARVRIHADPVHADRAWAASHSTTSTTFPVSTTEAWAALTALRALSDFLSSTAAPRRSQ